MDGQQDLGIQSEIPLAHRILRVVDVILWLLVVNPISALIVDLIFIVWLSTIVTGKLRALSSRPFLNAFLVLVLVLVALIWGYILGKHLGSLLQRLTVGRAVFGKVGGMESRLFYTSLKLARQIQYEFAPEDHSKVQLLKALDYDFTEAALKLNYRKKVYEQIPAPRPDLDSTWSKIWNGQILSLGVEGVTFRDALNNDQFAFSTIPQHLSVTISLVSPFIKIFQLVLIYLLARYLDGGLQLVTMIQVGVAMSFILSLLWFAHHVRMLGEIGIAGTAGGVPEELRPEFEDRVKATEGMKLRPHKISIKKRYFSLVRDFLARTSLIPALFINALTAFGLVVISLVVARFVIPDRFGELVLWHKGFATGLAAVSFGFLASYYITFWVLQNVRRIVAPLIASIIGALLPFGITYILTGRFEFSQLTNQLSAVLAGAGILLAATLGSLVKKEVEGDD